MDDEVTEPRARTARKPARPDGDIITQVIYDVRQSRSMSAGIRALETRAAEFGSEEQMQLAGLGMVAEARALLEDRLEEDWAKPARIPADVSELVVGSGYHAAVYCAGRVAKGCPRPYVLERCGPGGVGGLWAMSRAPSFYLNSRQDTFASLGLPDDGTPSLNALPGAPVQAHHISRADFIDNTLMRLIVRLTLARNAIVIPVANLAGLKTTGLRERAELSDGRLVSSGRVVDARGFGDPSALCDGDRVISFPQLMARMDLLFPMRGMGRVAVVGDGNSAMSAVEALLGIGPDQSMSSSALDFLPSIDWYAPTLPTSREDWRDAVRGRYQKIGSYLRRLRDDPPARRLRIRNRRADVVPAGASVLVNEYTYDRVIMCTGWSLPEVTSDEPRWVPYAPPGRSVPIATKWSGRNLFRIGPAAALPLTSSELDETFAAKRGIDVSMLRLATRTAALAASLA